MEVLGIDIGGSGIKGALVDTVSGELVSERVRVESPPTFQPEEVTAAVGEIVRQLDYHGPIGVGFPAVVIEGQVMTPPTSYAFPGWDAYPIAAKISEAVGCPTKVVNDGDAAGVAEISLGAGQGQMGVVMVFTLGTGIGSALFLNGRLVPNTELGHLYLRSRKRDAEYQVADRVRKHKKLSWSEWGSRLNEYFNHIERLFSPQLIIIGGGVSKKHHKFLPYIHVRAKVVPAALRNEAGIIGAAMTAVRE